MSTAPAEAVTVDEQIAAAQIAEFELEQQPKGALVLKECQEITKVVDESQYLIVCSKAKDAAANVKMIEAYMQPFIDRAHAAHKRLTTTRATLLAPFATAKKKFGQLAAQYQDEQEKAARKAEEEARAAAQKAEEEARAAQAEQLAAEGRVEEGVAVLEAPVIAAPSVVAREVMKVRGISAPREKFHAEVFDLMALVKAVAEGKVPLAMLEANQSNLDKQADMFGKMNQDLGYPGVRVKKELGISIRG
jgi:hypothetical protein